MKVRLMFLLGLLCSVTSFASCNGAKRKAVNDAIRPDSAVYYTLGKTMSEILFNPTKVTCYTIQGKSAVAKDDFELEPHYVRDSLITKLNIGQFNILQFNLLSDAENYKEDSIKVRSPYVPCIEFCFEKKKMEPVHVLISLSDFSWTIIYDDKRQGNWNYAEKRLMERYCKMLLGETLNQIR